MKAKALHEAARILLYVCVHRSGNGSEPARVRNEAMALAEEHPDDPALAQIVALSAGFASLRGQAAWVNVAEKIEDLARDVAERIR